MSIIKFLIIGLMTTGLLTTSLLVMWSTTERREKKKFPLPLRV